MTQIRSGRVNFIVHDCHDVFVVLLPIMAARLDIFGSIGSLQFQVTHLKKHSQVKNAESSLNDHNIL